MLYELRAYDLVAGKGPEYLDLFCRDGVQYVTRHLPMAGYWLTDSGALNRLYHLWLYESLEERLACRAGLAADQDWNGRFVPQGFPLILSQRNMIMENLETSPALEKVVRDRIQTHAAIAPGVPIFAERYQSLVFGTAKTSAELVGKWRVISGENPGEIVSLYAHAASNPLATGAGSDRHELLRPISVSPLR